MRSNKISSFQGRWLLHHCWLLNPVPSARIPRNICLEEKSASSQTASAPPSALYFGNPRSFTSRIQGADFFRFNTSAFGDA